MNKQFKNLVLYIESEKMLEDVKQIIIKYGQLELLKDEWLVFSPVKRNNYLGYSEFFKTWCLFFKGKTDYQITISDFEALLKNQKQHTKV